MRLFKPASTENLDEHLSEIKKELCYDEKDVIQVMNHLNKIGFHVGLRGAEYILVRHGNKNDFRKMVGLPKLNDQVNQ